MDRSKISRNRHFSGIKAPQGATRHRGAFQKLTSIELIHFPYKIKNRLFPKKWKLDGNLPIKLTFLPKTKMVRMVHRNLFYNTELKICDLKSELWRKTENLEGWENWEIMFEVQNWTFEGCFEVKMTFKNILGASATILV